MIKLLTVANPREQTTRVGTEKDYSTDSIPEEYLKTHIPEKVDYSLENILQDLLNFSADRLSLGGRLVYWIPIIRQEYKVKNKIEMLGLNILIIFKRFLFSIIGLMLDLVNFKFTV